jgi:hypothetical protein
MSLKSVFSYANVAHFAASAFSDLHKVFKFVEAKAPAVAASEPVVEGITAAVLGAASPVVTIERAAFSALGSIVSAVQAADDAAAAKGINISLDAEAVAAYKALVSGFSTELKTLGYSL